MKFVNFMYVCSDKCRQNKGKSKNSHPGSEDFGFQVFVMRQSPFDSMLETWGE